MTVRKYHPWLSYPLGSSVTAPPTTGTWRKGEVLLDDDTGQIYVCTASGTPGTWASTTGEVSATCRVHRAVAQSGLVDGTPALILYDTDTDDPQGMHSLVANTGRILPTVPGRYVFSCGVSFSAGNSTGSRSLHLCKNSAGAVINRFARQLSPVQGTPAADSVGLLAQSPPIAMNGTTDYAESFVIVDITSGVMPDLLGGEDLTWFAAHRVSA